MEIRFFRLGSTTATFEEGLALGAGDAGL